MANVRWARVSLFLAVAALPFVVGPAWAQDAELDGANTAWILTPTALVLFMTLPGLALFYGGLVRAQNVLSVLMHCFAIACLVSVLWLFGVYSLAFGDGRGVNWAIGGLGKAFLSGVVLVAVFAAPSLSGLGFADGVQTIGDQLWRQLVGAGATFVWAAIATLVLVVIVRAVVGLRVGEDEETEGLDRTSHGETGYNF